ncbi:hypothetical protein AAGS40_02855 [Paraburkholderia sp. PREW-6R]|uniref:hypothetical protein n=1 Tax=Paraburkholderia sp. PREW-6R TaxID=3141544 RepID=UPI0031F55E3A
MVKRQYVYRRLFLATCTLLLSLAAGRPAFADQDIANANVETAAERAHFAHDFCGVAPERITAYKERIRQVQHGVSDFEQHWQAGWRRMDDESTQMSQLREGDPAEFAARVKSDCGRLKWMAQNAVRPRSSK